jgi:hypothetical protein
VTTFIDTPGLAKLSAGDLVRELQNERQRKLRRLKHAQLKLAGLQALKKDLCPYLQPGDYEHIEDRLQREVTQRLQEEFELAHRFSAAHGTLFAWRASSSLKGERVCTHAPRQNKTC